MSFGNEPLRYAFSGAVVFVDQRDEEPGFFGFNLKLNSAIKDLLARPRSS